MARIAIWLCMAFLVPSAALASATKFYVPINRSEVVNSSADLSEVIVSNPEIADIFVHGKNSVSVIGKQLGNTSVRMFDGAHNLVRELDVVVTYDLPAIRKALHEFLPFERIGVEMVNTRIALTGEVSSAEAAASAVEIASQFVRPTLSAEQTLMNEDEEGQLQSTIINLMRIRSGQQVMLRIRFGEVSRSTIKALGTGLSVLRNASDAGLSFLTGGASTAISAVSPTSISGFATSAGGTVRSISGRYNVSSNTSVTAALEALERDDLIKILAEPNLVTISGEQAEFLSGGEIPVPIAQQDGMISVEFKTFGVSLRFTPYVLSENRIRIQVQPEVSSRNDAGGIDITGLGTGAIVPAFDVRRASTTVELAPGESFMIAGLIEDNLSASVDQLPGVNEIPVLSSLFRSSTYSREESELVIAVTPYLVDPLASADVRLPTDDFRPASFMETIFYGALGSLKGNVSHLSQTPTMEGPIGFMVD